MGIVHTVVDCKTGHLECGILIDYDGTGILVVIRLPIGTPSLRDIYTCVDKATVVNARIRHIRTIVGIIKSAAGGRIRNKLALTLDILFDRSLLGVRPAGCPVDHTIGRVARVKDHLGLGQTLDVDCVRFLALSVRCSDRHGNDGEPLLRCGGSQRNFHSIQAPFAPGGVCNTVVRVPVYKLPGFPFLIHPLCKGNCLSSIVGCCDFQD